MKVIEAGLVIDGTGQDPIENATVLVEGSTIKAVMREFEANAIPEDAEVVDVSDGVLMPGLIDVHVHLGNPQVDNRYKYRIETEPTLGVFYAAQSAQQTLAAELTTLRNMGGIEFVSLRRAINAGVIPGPRILTSGMILVTGGHTDQLLPQTLPRMSWQTADGVDEVRRRVREYVFAGADFIKFEATGGLSGDKDHPGTRNYTQSEVEAIVDEAHGLGVKVAAHAHGKDGILRAVKAGVDTLEHGTFLDDECIEKIVHRRTVLVPTLAIMNDAITRGPERGYSDEIISRLARLQEMRMEAVSKAHAAGVPIALGTDSSGWIAPHGENGVEFKLLVDAGLTPMESIMAGTEVAAKALGLEASVGTIEPGKHADLVVVRSTPLNDPSVFQDKAKILMVWKDGEVVVDRIAEQGMVQLRWPISYETRGL